MSFCAVVLDVILRLRVVGISLTASCHASWCICYAMQVFEGRRDSVQRNPLFKDGRRQRRAWRKPRTQTVLLHGVARLGAVSFPIPSPAAFSFYRGITCSLCAASLFFERAQTRLSSHVDKTVW